MIFLLLIFLTQALGREFSISGFGSGGYMAVQMHIAFSKHVKNVAGIAAGPYHCVAAAVDLIPHCTQTEKKIQLDKIYYFIDRKSEKGEIDSIKNLNDTKVYLFSGQNDREITPNVVNYLKTMYEHYIPQDNIKTQFDIPAGHGYVTDNYGNNCTDSKSPYINNCDFDLAGDILSFFYSDLKPKISAKSENLVEFSQLDYITSPNSSLSPRGFAYLPTNCKEKDCPIHIVLHGCRQNFDKIGDQFIRNSGFNEYGEANDIMIIYPQTKVHLSNFQGCWDFTGYTGLNYAVQEGKQMEILFAISQDPPKKLNAIAY
jgi:hypothetical protein